MAKQSISKADLERMLQEAQQKNAELQSENQRLRANKRPEGAPVFTGNVTFPHGTRKALLGGKASQSIRLPNNAGVIHLVGEWKESKSSGNVTCRVTGWLDPSQLTLQSADKDDEAKSTSSFQEQVVDAS
jgi:hypothetical protein